MRILKFSCTLLVVLATILVLSFGVIALANEVQLKVWNALTGYDSIPAMEKLCRDFEAENPEITVILETVPWGDIETKWAPAVASGTQPDMSIANPVHMSALAGGGFLEPLDDVINEIGENNLQPNYLKLHKMPDGKYYGIPWLVSPVTFWYRKDLLSEKGLEVPVTWDDWLNAASKLTTETTWGTMWWVSPNINHVFEASNKSYWLGPDGNVIYNSPETIETWKFMKELSQYGSPGFLQYDFVEMNNALAYGKVAMAPHYTDFMLDLVKSNPELVKELGNAQIPHSKVEATGLGGADWVIFKGPHVNETKKLLNFFMEKENVKYWFQQAKGGWMPPLQSLYDDADFWNVEPYSLFPDVYKVLIQNAAVGSLQGMDFEAWPWAGEIEGSYVTVTEFQKYVLEGKPVEDAVADAAKEMERIVEQSRRGLSIEISK